MNAQKFPRMIKIGQNFGPYETNLGSQLNRRAWGNIKVLCATVKQW
jgi:hypothetical protein